MARSGPLLVGGDGVVEAGEDPDAEPPGIGLQVGTAEQFGGTAEHLQRPLARCGHPQGHRPPVEARMEMVEVELTLSGRELPSRA
jgi:hypothetical protein